MACRCEVCKCPVDCGETLCGICECSLSDGHNSNREDTP